tara:strand:+ start:220 stop:474 length:255 start_codon:yes stop_codon:yes gene_type:complete
MIEKLKKLEQEAMDNLLPEAYDDITSGVLDDYSRDVYQAGYLDGLQTAIRIASEDSSTMSYTIESKDIFDHEVYWNDSDEDNTI